MGMAALWHHSPPPDLCPAGWAQGRPGVTLKPPWWRYSAGPDKPRGRAWCTPGRWQGTVHLEPALPPLQGECAGTTPFSLQEELLSWGTAGRGDCRPQGPLEPTALWLQVHVACARDGSSWLLGVVPPSPLAFRLAGQLQQSRNGMAAPWG